MSEGIITGTIYETRLRDKNCCLRYGKKKKKNTKCTMLLYFFGFLRLFSFHCVFLMCCFMSTIRLLKVFILLIDILKHMVKHGKKNCRSNYHSASRH